MSFLGKLFGGGSSSSKGSQNTKKGTETAPQTIQQLLDVEDMLRKKYDFIESKMKEQEDIARQHGTKNKKAALEALKRKKRFEAQLNSINGTLTTVEYQRESLESAKMNNDIFKTIKDANNALKQTQKDIDIDNYEDVIDEMRENQIKQQELTEALSGSLIPGNDVDEDDLLRELEELEQEDLDKDLIDVEIPTSIPVAPAKPLPASSTKVAEEEEEELQQLRAWGQ